MWEREVVNLNPQVDVDAEEQIQAHADSGDVGFLRALDMKLSRHPGFDAPLDRNEDEEDTISFTL